MTLMNSLDLMRQKYIADSGLGRLDPWPDSPLDHSILPNGVESCNNENGILFLAFMYVQALRAGYDISPELAKVPALIKSLEAIPGTPGLYNRQPFTPTTRTEAHDNYVGISTLCAMVGDTATPQAMIDWAWSHLFCFNNVEPNKFDPKLLRQGGEIALYYMAAKRKVPLFFMLWFLGGLIVNARQQPNPGQSQLSWLRLWMIDRVGGPKGIVNKLLFKLCRWYWNKKFVQKFSTIGGCFKGYFRKEHPVHSFEAEITSK